LHQISSALVRSLLSEAELVLCKYLRNVGTGFRMLRHIAQLALRALKIKPSGRMFQGRGHANNPPDVPYPVICSPVTRLFCNAKSKYVNNQETGRLNPDVSTASDYKFEVICL
jgi:hypothetical protein